MLTNAELKIGVATDEITTMTLDLSGGFPPDDRPRRFGHPLRYVLSRLVFRVVFAAVLVTVVSYLMYAVVQTSFSGITTRF